MNTLLLAGLLLCMTSLTWANETLPPGIIELKPYPAPTLHIDDLDGTPYKLEADRGGVVFVHFWASWCGPCREELPALQRMARQLEAEGLRIAVINTAEDEDTVFSFLASLAPDLRPLMDRDGLATEAWQPRGLPATYLVDQQGTVRYQALGGRDWDKPVYLEFLRGMLAEKNIAAE